MATTARYRGWTKRALKAQCARLEKEVTDLQHNAAPGFISIPLTPGAYRIYDGEGKDLDNGSILVTKYMGMSLTGRFLLKDGDEVVIRKGVAEKPTEIPPEQEAWFKNAGAPAEVLAEALRPHPFEEDGGSGCAKRACGRPRTASVHAVVWRQSDVTPRSSSSSSRRPEEHSEPTA